MEMLDIVLSFVPHYTRWDVLRYIDFQEEKTMNRTHLSVRMLCEAAVMVALAQILSYLKLMELPNGGSLTPAMFPIILFAVRWGTAPGLMAGFVFGLLQLIFDGAYAWGWQSMLLDYLAAFTPLGLAGLFKGRTWGIFAGTVVGCAGRFLVHYISGVTIYKILGQDPRLFVQVCLSHVIIGSLRFFRSLLYRTVLLLCLAQLFIYLMQMGKLHLQSVQILD